MSTTRSISAVRLPADVRRQLELIDAAELYFVGSSRVAAAGLARGTASTALTRLISDGHRSLRSTAIEVARW